MFSKAYQIASHYTQPILISHVKFDGTVECGVATFVIVNADGWIITAAHVFDILIAHQRDTVEINQYTQQLQGINNNPNLNTHQKNGQIEALNPNPNWIKNCSYWWGADHHRIDNIQLLGENDLAIGRLINYNPEFCKQYPVFKKPVNLSMGTSLCKLGYPFHEVKASFIEANSSFQIAPDALPIPRFPIDGILTREVLMGKSSNGFFDIKFIETSTPGLRGQSGGPIFDTQGNIWALQSRTAHLSLGFSPKIKVGNQEITEHQFINVGMGVHVETILKFMDTNKLQYQVSEE